MELMAITDKARKLLWGKSGNRCAICRVSLSVKKSDSLDETLIGEECHIISKSKQGPRYKEKENFNYDSYENLVLLCRNHHSLIDKQCETYTTELVRKIKRNHEKWVSEKLHDNKKKPTGIKRIEDNIPEVLAEIKDGKTLFGLIKGVMAHNFDYDEIRNDVEKEIIQEFNCCISETIDAWDLYEGSSYIDLHLMLDEKIKKLNDSRIMVFGENEMMYLTGGNSLEDTPWKVAHIKVVHSDNPEVVKM
ncbi:MAG: HNH endonuclease signature motif containing protein [Parabacteroides sp.]|nr:HNH endonuclease signature motif containing protein [Parabacteroides sp.]